MAKKRIPAPKAPPVKMGAVTQIRLQPTEKEGFEEAARLAGLTLSAWMRERLRSVARRELEDHGKTAMFLRK
jgi:hypothetical protein